MPRRSAWLLPLSLLATACAHAGGPAASATAPASALPPGAIAVETGGTVEVEAEAFVKQEKDQIRRWYLVKEGVAPASLFKQEGEALHLASASGGAYLEVLPDTRRTHDDPLIKGESYSDDAGAVAVLSYSIHFNTPGRYYVWVRAYSSGAEDNSVHVGLDGTWPESGRRMQWCQGKNTWRWESKQRTQAQHCGEAGKIFLDLPTAGLHTISFSLREDGFEFDRFALTQHRLDAWPGQPAQ